MIRQPQHFVTVDLLIVHPESWSALLIQRSEPPFDGLWALPGGHVEVYLQETLEQAARRELREETGLDCVEWPLRPLGVFGDPGRDPRGAYISILFVALADTPEQPIVHAGDDAGAVTWFPLQALPPLAFDHDRMVHAAGPYLDSLLPETDEQLVSIKLATVLYRIMLLTKSFRLIHWYSRLLAAYGYTATYQLDRGWILYPIPSEDDCEVLA